MKLEPLRNFVRAAADASASEALLVPTIKEALATLTATDGHA
jgi:hypothetical protein